MTEKKIEGYLILNWKTGKHRSRQTPPEDLGVYEIALPLDIDVEIPDVDVPDFSAKVSIPQPRVQRAVLESLDDEDFPDWTDVADDELEARVGRIQSAPGLEEVDALVERLTTRVLVEYDGVADASNVQQYLQDHAHALYNDAPRGDA